MRFVKMHGLGNDFILVEADELPKIDLAILAKKVCDRHFGIGADGLMLVLPSEKAAWRMRIFNSDGSEAQMCGNGIRCFARYVYDQGWVEKEKFSVETLAGIITPHLIFEGERLQGIKVDMGEPILEKEAIPMLGEGGQALGESLSVLDKVFTVTALLMGVPHCLIFVDNLAGITVEKYGPALENHHFFPEKTNVHFLEILNENEIKMRVWERGAGLTLACGTGACAALVAAVLKGKTKREALVHLPGGTLKITWAANNHVYMTGPAEYVFRGQWLEK